MYPSIERLEKYAQSNPHRPGIMIEYAHAMGNSVGNLQITGTLLRNTTFYKVALFGIGSINHWNTPTVTALSFGPMVKTSTQIYPVMVTF